MTVADLIELLQQSPELKALVKLRLRDDHDWIIWTDISEVSFNEREQTVVIDAESEK